MSNANRISARKNVMQPRLQNIPIKFTSEVEVVHARQWREIVQDVRPGYVFQSIDYTNLEIALAANVLNGMLKVDKERMYWEMYGGKRRG